jgi:DNA-binding response OmpR family regulator
MTDQETMDQRILVIEDDRDIAGLVRLHLEDLGCSVALETDGRSGLRRAEGESFDLIVLDLMLPGIDGLEVCKRIRSRNAYVPLLMLTARSSEMDRVLGLELGADDYLTKPFNIMELVARVKAILRRVDALRSMAESSPELPIHTGGVVIEPQRRKVSIEGRSVELTAREFDLLAHFARHPGRVFTRTQLLDAVWGYGHDGYEHTVNSHINRLRSKIEPDPSEPSYILTVWGVGYRMSDTREAS